MPSKSLVVGGTSGIGLASARALAAAGHDVHVVGRDSQRLAQLARSDPSLTTHSGDAAVPDSIGAIARSIAPISELVITLSTRGGPGLFPELDIAVLRRAFDEKLWPLFTSIQAALPYLTTNASITVLAAVTARTSMPGTVGIAMLNAAVEAMVRPLAVELAPIRVNAVSPGLVDTPWWGELDATEREAYFARTASQLPARQIASAEQIAEVVLLAATNANITGSILSTDGGLSLVSLTL